MSLDYYIKILADKYKNEDQDIYGNPMTLWNSIEDGGYKFDIIEEKKGGMANIYIGIYRHNDLENPCIIKVLNPLSILGLEKNPGNISETQSKRILYAYEKFTMEADILEKIKQHRKIKGLPYIEKQFTDSSKNLQRNLGFRDTYPTIDKLTTGIVMEYLDGKDFREVINFHNHFGKKIKPTIANYSIYKFCEALKDLHELGIIHKDIKPGNIYLSGKDIFSFDFGISSKIGEKTNVEEGTSGYIPPKYIGGTEKGDIYQTGMTWGVLLSCNTELPHKIQPSTGLEPDLDVASKLINSEIEGKRERSIILNCLNGKYDSVDELKYDINKKLDIATEKEMEEFDNKCQPELINQKQQQNKTSVSISQTLR